MSIDRDNSKNVIRIAVYSFSLEVTTIFNFVDFSVLKFFNFSSAT